MEFFTTLNNLYFEAFTYPSSEKKLNIIFSVMNDLVKSHILRDVVHENRAVLNIKRQSNYILYEQPRSCYRAYNIVMKKIYIIALRFSRNNDYSRILLLRVYDGPDSLTASIPLKGYYVGLSTFQCYLESKTLHPLGDGFENCFLISFAAKVETSKKSFFHIHIKAPKQLTLSQCHNRNVMFCIFNVTTEKNYINASLKTLNFTGPNIQNCMFGGIAYYQNVYSSEGNGSFLYEKNESKTFCDTFSSQEGSTDKLSMDFVSSESEMLIVIYGYHPHNTGMDVDIMVSAVPCKGVIPCQKGITSIIVASERSNLDIYIFIYIYIYIYIYNINQATISPGNIFSE